LGEIEATLNSHRSVGQSVVAVNEDEIGGKRLVGYVVGEGAAPAELKRHMRERVPEHMVPESIIVLEEMPLTANGKIDRKRLPSPADSERPMKERFVAPRDVLELQLAQIWEQILGVHPIGVTDNFVDLGGHSLLAVSLMARVRKVTGRQLPLSALFEGGTIERLATILRREVSSMSWSCLVELQASGSQPPLFFVHPGGGNVLCYLDLSRSLGADQPFYAFQTPGLYGERTLHTRIEDLAANYVGALTAIQPEGPYIIGGWSLGGVVAYEMAQQLTSQGRPVSHLLLLDSSAWTSGKGRVDVEEDQIMKDDAALLMSLLYERMPISREELEPFKGDERIDYILKRAVGMNLLPPDVETAQARSFLNVYRTNERAMRKYVPQTYHGSATLFKTARETPTPPSNGSARDEEIAKMLRDSTIGWGALVTGGVRVIDVPGQHSTMLSEPYVKTLAQLISSTLSDSE